MSKSDSKKKEMAKKMGKAEFDNVGKDSKGKDSIKTVGKNNNSSRVMPGQKA
jgi:hypothetical protein